jgi:UDP-N-acetylmuramoylalanine--D-glutamate ligase
MMNNYPPGSCIRSLSDIAGKKVTVMGIGLNGGGEEAVRFLLQHGASVLATDMKGESELAPTLDRLRADFAAPLASGTLRFVLGEHRIEDFAAADMVIKNPGVKYEGNTYLAAARAVETDLSIFLSLVKNFTTAPHLPLPPPWSVGAPARGEEPIIIGITGSKGKSTTAAALYDGLRYAGRRAFLAGNIGRSPLKYFELEEKPAYIVLELSSWQLRDLRGRGLLKPRIAVLTPVFRDHMNWYQNDMDAYVADKKILVAEQTGADTLICPEGNGPGMEWGDVFAAASGARTLRYHAEAGETPRQQNMRVACLALSALGIDGETLRRFSAEWGGLEHRMEKFHTWRRADGTLSADFYNDSAATVPEAAAAALSATVVEPVETTCYSGLDKLDHRCYFLTGGTDKELDVHPLAAALAEASATANPPRIFLLEGGTGPSDKANATRTKLIPLLNQSAVTYNGPYASLEEMLTAVKASLLAEGEGHAVVIFSPGATSFGLFSNEFDRGNKFKSAVKEMF